MNINDALKETGKACAKDYAVACYAKVNPECGLLWLYLKENDEPRCAVKFIEQSRTTWQPYHEIEEIRPDKSDEVWIHSGTGVTYLHNAETRKLVTVRKNILDVDLYNIVIHGKNGWIRLYPHVSEVPEDEEIAGEPEFPFWVRIADCSGEDFWYNDKIGNVYKIYSIEDYGVGFEDKRDFCTKDGELIKITDCEKVGVIIKCLDK